MLTAAFKAVERAKANGWAILVGDAEGVDAAVIDACNALQVNYVCFGISTKPRNGRVAYIHDGGTGRYWRVDVKTAYDYTSRDQRMIDLADRVLCIWDGQSKGTAAVAQYARGIHKQVDVLTFNKALPARKIAPIDKSTLATV